MRKLCPNFDREDALETVLEVPIPKEMLITSAKNNGRSWHHMKSWMRSHLEKSIAPSTTTVNPFGCRNNELQILLGVVVSPLIPLPISCDHSVNQITKDYSIEVSMAKCIVQQYIAATGGDQALNSIESMYAMGKVRMHGGVLLTSEGLDPRSTANLFSNSICIGEKTINDEACFVLKLEAELSTLRARSSHSVEIIRHTIWGYFSQKTGLLVQLEDSHLLRIKTSGMESIYWESTMESLIQEYRTIDGVNIAHGGHTCVSLFRFGESSDTHSRTRMEEVWTIEEVDFNIKGLSMDCFLPPSDLVKKD